MIPPNWIEQAAQRLKGRIVRTPLTYDPQYDLYLKWENRQTTGSFKIRGAFSKVLSLQEWELARGLVTASAGNHGQGVAVAARSVGAAVTVFASDHAVLAKLEAMRALGAQVELVQGGYAEAEQAALSYAAASGKTWISPYNDGQVIAGQATLAREILEQGEELTGGAFHPAVVVAPAGGGGLAAGVGLGFSLTGVQPQVVAVQSTASPFLHELYHRNTQAGVTELESLADGLAGAVEPLSITVPLVQRYIHDFILVTEEEITRAVAFAQVRYGETIEGSAAAALAAVLFGYTQARPAVVIISGGNIQPEVHGQVCARWEGTWKEERAR